MSSNPLKHIAARFGHKSPAPSAEQSSLHTHHTPKETTTYDHTAIAPFQTISQLKSRTHSPLPSWTGGSNDLVLTSVSANAPVRPAYLKKFTEANPPVIGSSEFVPRRMVEHLMRNKKDRAIGVKFLPNRREQITNMEGALHTFVTPLALVNMHGDYAYRNYHSMIQFSDHMGLQQARRVVLSALVQPDFEKNQVMVALASLGHAEIRGALLPHDFEPIGVEEKQDPALHAEYDARLRAHMVAHLTQRQLLPTYEYALSHLRVMTTEEAINNLQSAIKGVADIKSTVVDVFVKLRTNLDTLVSLELLWRSALHQARNEFSALESMCPQGYVYTFDPPSIFAYAIGAELLNRIQVAALYVLVRREPSKFANMRAYAYNDYVDPGILDLLESALQPLKEVRVVQKKVLFPTYGSRKGTYVALPGTEEALLVVHNNSDAFGQNIETEGDGGSLDGAIGCHSSAAASLHRQHPQLTEFLI